MPMFSKSFHWRKTPTSSDSKVMTHCSANASEGSRSPERAPLAGVELAQPVAGGQEVGQPLGVGLEDRHLQLGVAVEEADSRTWASQTCISWMKENVWESTPARVKRSPGRADVVEPRG